MFDSTVYEAPVGAEAKWLKSTMVQAGRKRVPTILVNVTPTLAAEFLECNKVNRALRVSAVENLATEVKEGRFMFTGIPIIMGWDGILVDGQHRLQTIVKTGQAVVMAIQFGVDPAARAVVDTGKPRSLADLLKMMYNVMSANEVAATLRYLWAWETRNEIPTNAGRKATTGQALDYAEQHLERVEKALASVPVNSVVSRSVLATFFARLTTQTPPEDVMEFITALVTGANLDLADPVLVARNWLLEKSLGHPNKEFDLLIQTWNAYRKGNPMRRRPTLRGTLDAVAA